MIMLEQSALILSSTTSNVSAKNPNYKLKNSVKIKQEEKRAAPFANPNYKLKKIRKEKEKEREGEKRSVIEKQDRKKAGPYANLYYKLKKARKDAQERKKTGTFAPVPFYIKRKKKRQEERKKYIDQNKKYVATIYVKSTHNNIILTLLDYQGNTKGWISAGSLGFKNARKTSAHAAQTAAGRLVEKATKLGFILAKIKMKGVGHCKLKAVRILCHSRLDIVYIDENTSLPHNGCRRPRRRRT